MTPRIPCRAVFLDAGGVIVLPHRDLVAGALARVGIRIDRDLVPQAHYRAVRAFDRAGGSTPAYLHALCSQLGIAPARTAEALDALAVLADRSRSGEILWSEPTPGALATIAGLGRRAGLAVVIVTNSDGHAPENLRDCGIVDVPVIDSVVVGSEKPDGRIFAAALDRAGGVAPADVVHVGDTLSADVAGARAVGITPIHFDPLRACRAPEHRHIRTLPGLWQHVVAVT